MYLPGLCSKQSMCAFQVKASQLAKSEVDFSFKLHNFVPPLHGLYMEQFYIEFHQFYITNIINNTMEYFVTGSSMEKVHMVSSACSSFSNFFLE